ncbi:MAG: hypothetical protein ABEJ56_04180 [Candidatus Nanohaloarchaea archaeon]
MAEWIKKQEITVGKLIHGLKDTQIFVSIYIMHNGHPYRDFVAQVGFPHPASSRRITLARIDRSHVFLHLDKLWMEEPEKLKINRSLDVWEAASMLEENWDSYFSRWSNRDDTEISEFFTMKKL